MGVGSVLLGRPWLFNCDVAQYGRTNRCIFYFGGNKQIWQPFVPPIQDKVAQTKAPVIQNPPVQLLRLVSACHVLKGVEDDAPIWAIQVRTKTSATSSSGYPPFLQDFAAVFPAESPDSLPSDRAIQLFIDFIPGATLPNLPHYRLNPAQSTELQQQVEELLRRGLIRESQSPCAVPALLAPKMDGTWRLCVDCQAINRSTMRYRFPIPSIDDLLDQLARAEIFSKLDLRNGYHQVQIREGDEWKTAFKNSEGLYECLVMPFGLSNAPSTFMRLMNEVLCPFACKFLVIYFDDILVYRFYRRTPESPPGCLRQASRRAIIRQYHQVFLFEHVCCIPRIHHLGGWDLSWSSQNIHHLRLANASVLFDIRSFHGLAQFYRRFVQNFSSLAAPLTDMFRQTQFEWSPAADRAFQQIKIALTTAPVLRLSDFTKLFDVATDVSGMGIGAVLSQDTHRVSYFSEKLSEAKVRYSNYDRELYAVVQSLKFWRHYLLHQDFTLYNDHDALRFLHSQKKLSARHGRWMEVL